MEWRTIPGFPAYEISETGKLRKTDTHYQITIRGRYARLWNEGIMVRLEIKDLVAIAFAAPCFANPRAAIPPRTSPKPKPRLKAKRRSRKRRVSKKRSKPLPSKPVGFYKPKKTAGQVPKMNLSFCPWSTGKIEGTALGADPVLGF